MLESCAVVPLNLLKKEHKWRDDISHQVPSRRGGEAQGRTHLFWTLLLVALCRNARKRKRFSVHLFAKKADQGILQFTFLLHACGDDHAVKREESPYVYDR